MASRLRSGLSQSDLCRLAPDRCAVSTVQALREQFMPAAITVLLVGESPPSGGTFFYRANSNLYRHTERAFRDALGERIGSEFLASFAALGCYLDDLCSEPVNQMSARERRAARLAGEAPLSQRLRTYSPRAIVGIGYGCEPYFARAHRAAAVRAPLQVLPFPNWPRQRQQYVEELTALLIQFESSGFLTA